MYRLSRVVSFGRTASRLVLVTFFVAAFIGDCVSAGEFTPIHPVAGVAVIDHAANYHDSDYKAENLLDGVSDGSRGSEYSSNGKGTETYVVFDFGKETAIVAFEHIDRVDPATVGASELRFSNNAACTDAVATRKVDHVNRGGGRTLAAFEPVTARYVRWQITKLGSPHATVGGAEIRFYGAGEAEATPSKTSIRLSAQDAIRRVDGRPLQPVTVTLSYPYLEPCEATLKLEGGESVPLKLTAGENTVSLDVSPVAEETRTAAALLVDGREVVSAEFLHRPVRPWVFYILPHSHVDIGFTHVQTDVMKRQWEHFEAALDIAEKTKDYPEGARFKWNAEVLWAVDAFLKEAPPEKKARFLEAVKSGTIGIDALYGNELTALCRPEELMRLLDCANRLRDEYGMSIDSAMISDVPGYTWGMVPVLAQNGIKYFSVGPNHCHRIGYTLESWGDKPFYWVGPSGEEKVLFWMDALGYAWFMYEHGLNEERFFRRLERLNEQDYPYDMVQVRYTIGGDNGPPDPALPDFVKQWNEKYESPRLVIATTSEMFKEFAARYADRLPEAQGDFTPYWEDGAASSARETAMARTASDRLVQAEALWAMLDPAAYPEKAFYEAWRNVILYNEHTWGAHMSISRPDDPFTTSQWKIKQAFALDAEKDSKMLLAKAVADRQSAGEPVRAVDVFNTCSWPRIDLVVLPKEVQVTGDAVTTVDGEAVRSQRLASGELAFLAKDVPAMGAKRFLFKTGAASTGGEAKAEPASLSNAMLRVDIDEATGTVKHLGADGIAGNLADSAGGVGLNAYRYVTGRDSKNVSANGPVTVRVKEKGPLVASLVAESDAPGCRKLLREYRLIDGVERVDIINLVDKEDIRAQESVHFGFAFDVPEGMIRMDTPFAVIRPEADQLPGACKNYFTVGSWIDVSNEEQGATWATIDAPLVEVGAIRVDVPSPFVLEGWVKSLDPTQTFYSYVMNNYWETNYKASQDGETPFRYSILPHRGGYDPVRCARFGIERSRPLVVVPVKPDSQEIVPAVQIEPESVIATLLRPSDDGKAIILRLFNVGDSAADAKVTWRGVSPQEVQITSADGGVLSQMGESVRIAPKGIVTVRAVR